MKIKAKFAENLLVPANGISRGEVETTDGFLCHAVYQASYNNSDGRFDEEFERICQKYYGISFQAIKSIWIGRLGRVDDYWHFVKLIKK